MGVTETSETSIELHYYNYFFFNIYSVLLAQLTSVPPKLVC